MVKKQFNKPNYRVNDEIRGYSEVRIIGDGIESKVMSLNEAKQLSNNLELDLVEINNKASIPIIRLCNYEKFLYEQKKMAKKNKPTVKPLKEIQLSVNIASNDLKTKSNKAREFIEDGSKVKVTLTMRGREMSRRDENKKSLYEFIELLSDVSTPESFPKDEGNKTIVILKKK